MEGISVELAGHPSENQPEQAAKLLAVWHSDCCFNGMITTVFILSALVAAGLVIELIAAARAPLGYQDESGFHFGREGAASSDEFESGNPS